MVKIQIIGRLGQDAVKTNINGKDVIKFFVGVDQSKGESKTTRWLMCYSYNDKLLPYLTKGKLVYVDGPHRATISSKDGKTYLNEYVNVDTLQLLSSESKQSDLPEGF